MLWEAANQGRAFLGAARASAARSPQPAAPFARAPQGTTGSPPGRANAAPGPPLGGSRPQPSLPWLPSSIFQHPAASRAPRGGSLLSARRPPARQGEPSPAAGPAAPGAISPPLLSAASPAPAAPSPGRRQRGAARHSPAALPGLPAGPDRLREPGSGGETPGTSRAQQQRSRGRRSPAGGRQRLEAEAARPARSNPRSSPGEPLIFFSSFFFSFFSVFAPPGDGESGLGRAQLRAAASAPETRLKGGGPRRQVAAT